MVAGINVGAQPYWNAESTMLMHTRGILVMTPESAMVLTGKQAIDYSGGVSAEDNFGIGGYGRVMGPNGEAQYWAPEPRRRVRRAVRPLRAHLSGTGRTLAAARRHDGSGRRDVRTAPHEVEGVEFRTVGDVFSDVTNPDRRIAAGSWRNIRDRRVRLPGTNGSPLIVGATFPAADQCVFQSAAHSTARIPLVARPHNQQNRSLG